MRKEIHSHFIDGEVLILELPEFCTEKTQAKPQLEIDEVIYQNFGIYIESLPVHFQLMPWLDFVEFHFNAFRNEMKFEHDVRKIRKRNLEHDNAK